jgi:hypothetical protein
MRGFVNMRKSGFAKMLLLALGLPVVAGAQTFKYWDVKDTSKVPKTLSATGLYTDIMAAKKTMISNAYHFEVNSALWSDGSAKKRWVLKKGTTAITYDKLSDYWGYPDSSVFVKQFAVDTVPGDTNTRFLVETRFLVSRKDTAFVDSTTTPGVKKVRMEDVWYGYSYRWNKDQKDAKLVENRGYDDTTIKVYPNGKNNPGIVKKWRFPSRDQCNLCHRVSYADTIHGRSVLGFFTAQLNRPHPTVANINQLEYFFQQNVLKGTKSVWTDTSTPRWYGIEDSTASVDSRARAYIAANCSGCHGRRGMETGGAFGIDFNYDFHTMVPQMEVKHKRIGYTWGLDTVPPFFYPKVSVANPNAYDSLPIDPALVVPGYPEKSAILYRQTARNTTPGSFDTDRNQMPPAASFEVNVKATALISRWIKEMEQIRAPNWNGIRSHFIRSNLKSPAIQNRQVILPIELAGPGLVKVSMTGINGRSVELNQVSRLAYALPGNMTPGVYIIRVNKRSFTTYLY